METYNYNPIPVIVLAIIALLMVEYFPGNKYFDPNGDVKQSVRSEVFGTFQK